MDGKKIRGILLRRRCVPALQVAVGRDKVGANSLHQKFGLGFSANLVVQGARR